MASAATASTPTQVTAPRIPFMGFDAYSENDSDYFFGRAREIRIVTSNLIASRLTLLHADSGVGKTSLLRAGVAAGLLAEARDEFAGGQRPRFFPVVFDSWKDDDPMAALTGSVQASIERSLPKSSHDPGGQGPQPKTSCFLDALNSWTECVDGALLIVLDQFEQYFERHAGKDGGGPFAHEFPEAVNDRSLRVNFLISIREEWLGRMDFFKTRIPRLFDNRLEIKRLDESAARDAIERPVARYNEGIKKAGGAAVELGEGLVDAVLKDIARGQIAPDLAGQGGGEARPDEAQEYEAPYLQLVMRRLWEKEAELGSSSLRKDTLNGVLGGAKEIVLQYVNSVMESLTQRRQRVAAVVFRYLVTPSGAKVAYSAPDLMALAEQDKSCVIVEKLEEYEGLLRELVERRILRPAGERHAPGGADPRYEVFHDMLARPVLAWRLKYLREAESKRRILAPQALYHLRHGECERAALLARQAYLFNKDVPEVLPQVDAALREVLSANPFTYVWHRNPEFDFPAIAFSAKGNWLAAGGKDGYVYLWDLHRRLPPWSLRLHWQGSEVYSVAFSHDERMLATAGQDKTLKLVDLGVLAQELPDFKSRDIPYDRLNPVVLRDPHEEYIRSLAFRGEGRTLASGSWDGFLRLWNVDGPYMLREWHGHQGGVWSVGFSPDGTRFASAGRDSVVRLWDWDRPDMLVASLQGHQGEVISLAFAPDGEHLASAGGDRTVRIWTKDPGREWHQATGRQIGQHKKPVRGLAFSADGQILASASEDETVRLWDPQGAPSAPPMELLHFYGVGSVAFRPQCGRTLFSSCWDRTVRVWDIYPVEPRVLEGHRDSVQSVAFGAGNTVASGSWDKTVRLWDANRPDACQTFSRHGAQVYAVALYSSPDMQVRTLASGCLDGFVRLWNLAQHDPEGSPPRELSHGAPVSSIAFGTGGAILASGSHNGTVRLWNLQSGDPRLAEFTHGGQSVTSVAFNNDGTLLASGSDDAEVKLWSLESPDRPKLIATLKGHDGRVWSVAFSPDGRHLASGGDDHTVQLWRIEDPSKPMRTLFGHEFWVGSVAFSPSGKLLATGGYDRTIRLWDLDKLSEQDEFDDDPLVLRGHQQSVTSVAFSPDGKLLASGSTDNTVRIWTLELEALADRVCSKVSRNLSWEEWEKAMGLGVKYQSTCSELKRGEGVPEDA